jgi:hypothetical protein
MSKSNQVVMRVIVTSHQTADATMARVEDVLDRAGFHGVYVEPDISAHGRGSATIAAGES